MAELNGPLWIFQVLLALYFLRAGFFKVALFAKAQTATPWVKGLERSTVSLIGALEILGALAIVLPVPLGLPALITPVAAVLLALVELLAAVRNGKAGEHQAIMINGILIGLIGFVAVGRFLE